MYILEHETFQIAFLKYNRKLERERKWLATVIRRVCVLVYGIFENKTKNKKQKQLPDVHIWPHNRQYRWTVHNTPIECSKKTGGKKVKSLLLLLADD